jgi:hypothetical protein
MEELRKKVLLELLVTPATMIPSLIGGSLLLLSGMLGGFSAFFGFIGLLIGFGAFLTNLVFNLEKIHVRTLKQWTEQQNNIREKKLDSLDRKLSKTAETDDENALRNLRTLYKTFGSEITGEKFRSRINPDMLQSIDDIFDTCVSKLERSYEMYRTIETMTGRVKHDMQRQRINLIAEVEASIIELSGVINEIRVLRFKDEGESLKVLQRRLSSQLEVAKATEESLAALTSEASIDKKLDEYQ